MSRKIKLILIVILVGILIFGVLFSWKEWQKSKQLAPLRENFRRCQNLEDLAEEWSSIPGEESSLGCLSAHDIYFCNPAPSEKQKEQCEVSFYQFQALKENNIDYCQKTKEKTSFCQAVLKKDETLCEKGELPQEEKTLCKAAVKEDEKECENLEEIGIQKCKDNLYHLLAILKKDIALCDKISYKRGAQILCRGILDINECLKYRVEVQCPEIYLPQIASLLKDASLCEKMPYKEDDDIGVFFYQTCLENAK